MKKIFILFVLAGMLISFNIILPCCSKPNSHLNVKNKINQPILSIIETKIDSKISKEGEEFSSKLMEDVFYNGEVLVPKTSMAYGIILKIKKAGKMDKDALIKLQINKIKMPDEKIISIENKPMIVEISKLAYTTKKENFFAKIPSTVANTATSVVLGNYSSIADVAVWAISTGAGITAGMISGIISPDDGKTRSATSAERALDSTPIGSVKTAVKKGNDISLKPGQYICIVFDLKTVKQIKQNISCN